MKRDFGIVLIETPAAVDPRTDEGRMVLAMTGLDAQEIADAVWDQIDPLDGVVGPYTLGGRVADRVGGHVLPVGVLLAKSCRLPTPSAIIVDGDIAHAGRPLVGRRGLRRLGPRQWRAWALETLRGYPHLLAVLIEFEWYKPESTSLEFFDHSSVGTSNLGPRKESE